MWSFSIFTFFLLFIHFVIHLKNPNKLSTVCQMSIDEDPVSFVHKAAAAVMSGQLGCPCERAEPRY